MAFNVVIVGGVALGPKTACRLKRLMPEARVTVVDRDSLISYGGCGIPYFVSGDVSEATELMSTSFHMVRDAEFFRLAKDVDVLTRTEATGIDRDNKTVHVKNLDTGEEKDLAYDKLVLGLGSKANRLPVEGATLDGVFTVATLNDAIAIKDRIAAGRVGRAVVVGGGAIGLEMAEALSDLWGVETTLIEIEDQLLPGVVSPVLAGMVKEHLREHEIDQILLKEKVVKIEGDGAVERVVTDQRTIDTDMVILAVGVSPNAGLAVSAGLDVSPKGAIVVNDRLQTSDPDIYAGGDCIECRHLVTGKSAYFPSGSLANRQGRIIGSNLAGREDTFPGVVGAFILKAFDVAVASAGLSLARAKAEGFDAFSVLVVQGDRAHFYPDLDLMYLDLVVEKGSGRVLGIQGLSGNGHALGNRINPVAAMLKYQPTVEDISNLELAYAPPFAAAMDIINALGNTADNMMAGNTQVIDVDELAALFEENQGRFVCLDVRGSANAAPFVEKYPDTWVNIPQEQLRDRIDEVPRDKDLILVCNSGVRSYEAQITLNHLGLTRNRNLQGGYGAMKKYGLKLEA